MRARGALVALLCLAFVPATHEPPRLAPVSHFHDLVAGSGVPGFENGEFTRASFRSPLGLAILEKKAALAVADRDNNRIRVVWLADNNRVGTLAGSGSKGSADGPLLAASFDAPSALTAVSDHSLVVNDEGSRRFRLVDLDKGTVETIAGNGAVGQEAGPARKVALGGVWNLVYMRGENAIYFSQPDLHVLRRFDLESRTIFTVLHDDSRCPSPMALSILQGKLVVADRSGQIWKLEGPVRPGNTAQLPLTQLWKAKQVLALAVSDDRLYALQQDPDPAIKCLNADRAVVFPTAWGDEPHVPFVRFEESEPVGFLLDPRAGSSFFLASPSLNAVLCVKDYRFDQLSDPSSATSSGLVDFEYPTRKPERSFRILILGDSRVNSFDVQLDAERRELAPRPRRVSTIPKRLELMLNTLATVDGTGVRFEVLSLTRVSWEPLLVWPIYEVAEVVRKFDVDLVLLMLPPVTTTLEAYMQRPIGADGLPAATIDGEHLLLPLEDRLRGNPAAEYIERCKALGLFEPEGDRVDMTRCGAGPDAPARRELLALFSRPLGGIRDKLVSARPGGGTPAFVVCYYGTGRRGAGVVVRDFWKELCEMQKVAWLDLVDPLVALADTWFPLSESGGDAHFVEKGHILVAFLLAHELIRIGAIPGSPRTATLQGGGAALALAAVTLALAGAFVVLRRRRPRAP